MDDAIAEDVALTVDTPSRGVSEQEIWLEETEALKETGLVNREEDFRPAGSEDSSRGASLGQGGFGRVDEHGGSYSYSVPVFFAASRMSASTPSLALTYNSSASSSKGFVANGWRLAVSKIERRGPNQRLPEFANGLDSTDFFVLELDGSSFTLVRLKPEGPDDKRLVFRAKIEGAFMEAEAFVSDTAIDPDSKEAEIDHWLVRDSKGGVHQFAQNGSAGVKNHPSATIIRNKAWFLVESRDVYGVSAKYEYSFSDNEEVPDLVDPVRLNSIRYDVTKENPDGNFKVDLSYTREGSDPFEGFHILGNNLSGRFDEVSVIWDRLKSITSFYRAEDGEMRPVRELVVNAGVQSRRQRASVDSSFSPDIKVNNIFERGFNLNGSIDPSASLPPHKFTYKDLGQGNRNMLVRVEEPLGRIQEIDYGFVADLSEGTNIGLENRVALRRITTLADKERKTVSYSYTQGIYFSHLDEHRGFAQVTAKDHTTGTLVVTNYTQSGVHNGFTKDRTEYLEVETGGSIERKILKHLKNDWVALDYQGGRFHPFPRRTETTVFGEDGKTPLVTTVSIIAEANTPWGFAIDEFGNVQHQISQVFEGGGHRGQLLRSTQKKLKFLNLAKEDHRIIGLVTREESWVNKADGNPLLIDWQTKRYDEFGREIEAELGKDRKNLDLKHQKRTVRDDRLGRRLEELIFDGKKFQRQTDRTFYGDGPYRDLLESERNANGDEIRYLAYDLRFGRPIKVLRPNGLVMNSSFDGLWPTASGKV